MNRLFDGVPAHGLVLLALFGAALVAAPYLVSNYVLSVLIIVLYFAYVGQAWNLMLGFAGLLSLDAEARSVARQHLKALS